MVAKIKNPTLKPESRMNTREGPFRGPENLVYSLERRAKVKARVFLIDTARASGVALGSPGHLDEWARGWPEPGWGQQSCWCGRWPGAPQGRGRGLRLPSEIFHGI